MADSATVSDVSPEEPFNRLSVLRLNILRHYASFFCPLPSTDRRNKHDLIYWLLQNSSASVLNRLLAFATDSVC